MWMYLLSNVFGRSERRELRETDLYGMIFHCYRNVLMDNKQCPDISVENILRNEALEGVVEKFMKHKDAKQSFLYWAHAVREETST
jgi:hypothetical protein